MFTCDVKNRLKIKHFIKGEEINFDFEVEKDAFAGFFSCGAWLNGEYFIIDITIPGSVHGEPRPGFIRKVKIL